MYVFQNSSLEMKPYSENASHLLLIFLVWKMEGWADLVGIWTSTVSRSNMNVVTELQQTYLTNTWCCRIWSMGRASLIFLVNNIKTSGSSLHYKTNKTKTFRNLSQSSLLWRNCCRGVELSCVVQCLFHVNTRKNKCLLQQAFDKVPNLILNPMSLKILCSELIASDCSLILQLLTLQYWPAKTLTGRPCEKGEVV